MEGEKEQDSSQREAVFVGTGQGCAGPEGLQCEAAPILGGWGCWERGLTVLDTYWSCLTCYFSNNLMTFKSFLWIENQQTEIAVL